MMNMREHALIRAIFCFCAAILCAATVIFALPTQGEEQIYHRVIRLHVLANSDTAADQALKLRVRDAILAYLAAESHASTTADEAEAQYQQMLAQIEEIAEQTAAKAGYAYDCHVTLTREAYPVRSYGSVTLPAGTYRSLRVMIGEAAGQNWWCVLFPPLCLSLAADAEACTSVMVSDAERDDTEEVLLAAGFTPYEVSLIAGGNESAPKTVVRFRIVEWLRALFADE